MGGSNDCGNECMVISIVPFNWMLRTLIRAKQILFLRAIRFVFEAVRGSSGGYAKTHIR
jgi:hypothetical protein